MKHRLLNTLLGLCLLIKTYSQNYEKIWFDKTDSIYGYYTVIPPVSGRIQGALVLMDGYGGDASSFLTEIKIHNIASANNILTVCVPTGMRLYADKTMQQLLNKICMDIIRTYGVKKEKFAFGGFSAGGTIVLRYAELCREKPGEYPVLPAAVFTGDSPVDLMALYQSSKRELRKNFKGWWLGESQMIIDSLETHLGKPEIGKNNFEAVSPFNEEDTTTGNEQYLKEVAYRTYHDVDVQWQIDNRRRSIFQTNMLPASELVNRLVLLGNNDAAFIQSKQPGRRNNGMRHPHSWSIIDEIDLVQWLRAKLHFYPEFISKPYAYNAPQNWSPETILFPIDFAPSLPYKGYEELRFAPGWGNAGSNEKWAYTILWWLDDDYTFDETVLKHDLEAYFSGLTKRRAIADKLDMAVYTPAKAGVKKIKTDTDDIATYQASLDIFDAQVTKKPGSLNVKIHQKKCDTKGNTIVLLEIAAADFNQPVWLQLDKINADFKCEK